MSGNRIKPLNCLLGAAVLLTAGLALQAEEPQSEAERQSQKQALIQQIKEGKDVGRALWGLYAARFTDDSTAPLFYEALRGSEDPAVRKTALMLMWRRRLSPLSRAVVEALDDPDANVRLAGLEYLDAAKDDPAVIPAVRKYLDEDDLETRWLAARALAMIPAAFTALAERAPRLAADADPLIRQAFLSNIAPGESVLEVALPILLTAVQQEDPMTRMAAAQSLGRLRALAEPGAVDEQQAGEILDALMAGLSCPEEKIAGAAGYALKTLWNAPIEGRVRAALESEDLTLRARSADLLRKCKLNFDPAVLTEVVTNGDQTQQLYACGTLARVQTEACVPVAKVALQSEHASVRQSAVYALEVMEFPSAAEALTGALTSNDANVRRRAAQVLGRRAEPSAVTALRSTAASDADPAVRRAAEVAAALAAGDDLDGVLVDRDRFFAEAARLEPKRLAEAAGKPTSVEDGVAHVGSHKQLLVDDLVLDNLGGAMRVMHRFRKDPRNPVLEQRYPWELMGTLSYETTVHYDPATRVFTCWYTSLGRVASKGEAVKSRAQLIAYSTDGIHWVRPKVGAFEYEGSKANNLVGSAANIVPIPDEPDPSRRYASYIYSPQFNALAVSFSADGISGWTPWERVCGGGKDVVTACRDPLGGGYFSFMKWRLGRWYRRSAWAAWGETPDRMTYCNRIPVIWRVESRNLGRLGLS